METQLLYSWAKFHSLTYLEKRQLVSQLIAEKLNIHCEARIYRILTRLTFQTLQKKYGENHQFTADERRFQGLLAELELPASTVLNWYYSTARSNPFYLQQHECKDILTGQICECTISPEVREKLKDNYEFKLASKRLYQIMVRLELFKELLIKKEIHVTDDELRLSLRGIVEYDYYLERRKKPYVLKEIDLALQKILQERGIRAITVLRWLYLLRHHPELLRKVYQGEINPDDIFDKSALLLAKSLRGDIDGNSNVCNGSKN